MKPSLKQSYSSLFPTAIWHLKPFHDLTLLELYQFLRLREQVFMLEQTSLYQDLDGDDLTSYHLFLTPISKQATKKNRDIISSIAPSVAPVIAYGRLIPLKESSQPPTVRLGRIVVAPSYRRQGLGKELVIKLLKNSQKLFPHHNHLEISAQTSLIDFYQSFGFTIDSEPYLDGGIWHTTMRYS